MTTLPLTRRDCLPEHHSYRDDGCEYSPSCLTCPLPLCKYDDPRHSPSAATRNHAIYRQHLHGAPVHTLAATFNLSTRSVHRIIQLKGAPPYQPGRAPDGITRLLAPDDQPTTADILAILARPIVRRPRPLPPLFLVREDPHASQ